MPAANAMQLGRVHKDKQERYREAARERGCSFTQFAMDAIDGVIDAPWIAFPTEFGYWWLSEPGQKPELLLIELIEFSRLKAQRKELAAKGVLFSKAYPPVRYFREVGR